jgi:hypothetical protein
VLPADHTNISHYYDHMWPLILKKEHCSNFVNIS